MHKTLPPDQLHWIGVRFLDPNGRTCEFEGEIYRAIYPDKVAHVRELFSSGLVARLVERGWLIESEITDLEIPGYGLVLHHRRAPFTRVTGSYHWTGSVLLDAAHTFIEMNLELAKHGLGLTDGHPGNFAQIDCCRPVWIDFGSIVPLRWPTTGLAAFSRYFTNPLKLLARSSETGRMVRALIRAGGIDDRELQALAMKPERALRRILRLAPTALARARLALPADAMKRRVRALRMAQAELPKRLPSGSTQWGEYRKQSSLPENYDHTGPRPHAVLEVLQRLRPRQVIDLASNAGFFSFMAARQGAEVLAVDYDEVAVEKLYGLARDCRERLSVTSACFDVARHARQNANLPQGDLVMALALTHHLALGQSYPWENIASVLSGYSRSALLVEFMPNGRGGRNKPESLPEWYTLERFLAAFRVHFERAEVIPYPPGEGSPRTLVLCEGKK